MRIGLFIFACSLLVPSATAGQEAVDNPEVVQCGLASWYGEDHRGKLMANGQRFDPDKLTAASWFYPLGTRVRVALKMDPRVLNPQPQRSVWVTITDRGPHRRLVREGRIIDLSHAVFRRLADPDLGLVEVVVHPELQTSQVALHAPGY
jgi:rare lipoprotein A